MKVSTNEHISLVVNGETREVRAHPSQTLLDNIREDLGLTGAKKACDNGECGSCIVLMNNKPIKACLLSVNRAQGKEIVTIEGLAASHLGPGKKDSNDLAALHPLQIAFLEKGATQCGFCIPGMIMRASALLISNNNPTREGVIKSLSNNLCRCTGYVKIIDAVMYASELLRANEPKQAPIDSIGAKVGASVARLDSLDTINGEAKYGADLKKDGMLYAKILRSDVHHARIDSIDVSEAEAVPGVEAVLTADDVPGTPYLPNCQPQVFVFPRDRIRFRGEGLAAVAAQTEEIAEEALAKIKIVYQELPSAIELDDAIDPRCEPLFTGMPNISPIEEVSCGHVDAGFSAADVIVENTYSVPVREHAAMETESALAYQDEDGTLIIETALYHPFVQGTRSIANNMGMDAAQIRIICPAMGGNFGSRGDTLIAVVAALCARKTGKATKIVLSRAESLLGSSKAPSVSIRYKTGATKEGRIVAVDTEVIHGAGTWAPHLIPETTKGAELCYFETLGALLSHATGPYVVPNVRARAYDVLTNGPRYVPLRGTNANYLPLAYESQLDQIAEKLGMDPLEIRTLNAIREGSKTHIGQVLHESVSLLAELEALRPHYEKAKARSEKRRAGADGPWKPGVGIGCGWRNIGYVKTTISAGAELTGDGFIHVLAGSVEQGQGPTTQLAQIAADVFGVSMSTMRVTIGDTSAAPYPVPTFSSITTVATGKAVQTAAGNLAKLLKGVAAQMLEVPLDSLRFNDRGVYTQESVGSSVSFAKLSAYLHDQGKSARCEGVIEWDGEAPNILFGYNTGLIELEVNVESGRVRLLNHVNVCDPGTRINPLALEGQVDGGIAFGIGCALSEKFHPDNPPTLKDYGLSATTDIPETITRLFVEEPLERGPFGAKSMAEHPGISPIPAIISGIYNATGARIYDLPATSERIKSALQNNRNHSNKVRGEKITL